ncbi:redoxin domain-containing protein [Aquibacillus albus]|uniref:Peroxiredoxin n=1 Tax=Aquibacillus albus TaxID=1168171 RepID=A0ABS2N1Y1_9BACI|nr:redoxin domain-containing protein [Aquibacillus albus]MBM7572134.1 peroxiredoxin [Aquibacillus albus]
MYRKIFAFSLLVVLIAVFVYELTENHQNNKSSSNSNNEIDVTGDTSVDGTAIVAPNDKALEVGEKAPNFTLETIDGQKVTLSDFEGQIVYLNFWATWCGPCRVEMPEMHDFQNEFEEKVEMIAVNVTNTESSVEVVEDFVARGDFSFTIVLDVESKVSEQYNLLNLPTTYIIGKDGKIKERVMGQMTYEYMEELYVKHN